MNDSNNEFIFSYPPILVLFLRHLFHIIIIATVGILLYTNLNIDNPSGQLVINLFMVIWATVMFFVCKKYDNFAYKIFINFTKNKMDFFMLKKHKMVTCDIKDVRVDESPNKFTFHINGKVISYLNQFSNSEKLHSCLSRLSK